MEKIIQRTLKLCRRKTGAVLADGYLLQHASLPTAVLQVGQELVQYLGDMSMLVHLSTIAERREHQSQTQHTASSEGGDRGKGQEKEDPLCPISVQAKGHTDRLNVLFSCMS